jgi:uroporphyrinogen III methyltransferase/synthase
MSIVYLIGAGPGDPGLLTVRGRDCLAAADVVLYDRHVHARVLRYARPDAEKIDLGSTGSATLQQEAICYLLAEKAREGKSVARLKWGDPFVFDQGAAEALFLHEQGVRFEVVPGVPAGIAAPAYAGVPITYPGGGDTLTFVRGQDCGDGQKVSIDWSSLARLDGTIVCYARAEEIHQILSSLVSHGHPADDSAAVVYDGTLPTQHTISGTLEEVAAAVAASGDHRLGILVVGRVANLRDHLRWFDAKPLFGKRILVTRPRDQAAELVRALEAVGAETIEAPMIRIAPPDDFGPLDEACARVGDFDWIVFSSSNAVDAFFDRLLAGPRDLRAVRAKLCGVGPATGERLAEYGLKVDLVPDEYRAESLVQALTANGHVAGVKVLVPRADIGRTILADELRRHGADVTEVIAYRTVVVEPEREGEPDVYRMLLEKRIDVVTFTSASAVRNFIHVLGAEPAADLLRATVVASIGPVTAEAASQSNVQTTIMPAEYTVPALVAAIVDHFRERKA